MKKANKYNYFLVIQQNYGQGFEDVSQYEATSQKKAIELNNKVLINKHGREYKETLLKHDLIQYNLMGYSTRVIFRKELKTVN